jgi:predicted transporter
MELKSLLLGLAFTVGIFAVKSGAGLSCLLGREGRKGRRLALILVFVAGYLSLFFLAWLLVLRFDFLAHLQMVMTLVKQGMAIHFLLAALLLLWGVVLLRQSHDPEAGSRGWLLLTVPCPVCFSVILCSAALLHGLYPDNSHTMVWLFAGFVGVAMASALLLMRPGRQSDHRLGRFMLLAALYFLVSVAVVPQFSNLERIYRLGSDLATPMDSRHLLILAGLALGFGLGFLNAARKTSRNTSWT